MPLQLLNLGVIIPSAIMRLFVTRTPRGVLTSAPVPNMVPTCSQILQNSTPPL